MTREDRKKCPEDVKKVLTDLPIFSSVRPFNSCCSLLFSGIDDRVLIVRFDTKEQRDAAYNELMKQPCSEK